MNQDWKETKKKITTTILANKYIPETHKRLLTNQVIFVTYESEELLYGGMAGGGKSDALLMSALQYVTEEDYHALLLRRTYKDLALPNAIMNRCHNWLNPFVVSKEVKWDNNTKTYTFPSGATLTFGYLAHDNDLDQYQGSELQFVGFDELTQFTERQYKYLHSRLRKLENSDVPIRMRGGTNPGGRGHDWVKDRFITGEIPYIPASYLDNIYLDRENYGKQLDKLDELTKQQLKYGNWDIVLSTGLLMDIDTYNNRKIESELFKDWTPVYTTIGIDPASGGGDRFSMACLTYFTNQKIVLVDLDSTTSGSPENRLIRFIMRNKQYLPRVINFEREQGSASKFALNYWRDILNEVCSKVGCYVTDTPASNTGSKYNRAYGYAYHIRKGSMLINKDIPMIYDDPSEPYNPIEELGNQLVYLHPDKEVMKDFRSPDESDSVAYAFEKLQQSIGGLGLSQ